jgi:hypothetical protein
MRLEVRDSSDQVIGAYEFEYDPNQEPKITIQSSAGGSTHVFQSSTPLIYMRVPTYELNTAETEPAADTESVRSSEPESESKVSAKKSNKEPAF